MPYRFDRQGGSAAVLIIAIAVCRRRGTVYWQSIKLRYGSKNSLGFCLAAEYLHIFAYAQKHNSTYVQMRIFTYRHSFIRTYRHIAVTAVAGAVLSDVKYTRLLAIIFAL